MQLPGPAATRCESLGPRAEATWSLTLQQLGGSRTLHSKEAPRTGVGARNNRNASCGPEAGSPSPLPAAPRCLTPWCGSFLPLQLLVASGPPWLRAASL